MTTTVTQPVPSRQAVRVSDVPDPDVPERARRRTYTAKYKRDVLAEYEGADRAGKGALLRREGLYSSLISAWRDQRDAGALQALGKPAGAAPADPAQRLQGASITLVAPRADQRGVEPLAAQQRLSLIHISEPTRRT